MSPSEILIRLVKRLTINVTYVVISNVACWNSYPTCLAFNNKCNSYKQEEYML